MRTPIHFITSAFVLALSLLLAGCATPPAEPSATISPASDPASVAVAKQIVKASGGDVWPTVKRIRFTFNVENEGTIVVKRSHDWDVVAGTDTVKAGDQTFVTYVRGTDNMRLTPQALGEHQKAFGWWTNDSYWLLMPLKLLDPGVVIGPMIATKDDPPSRGRMTIRFEGVGQTPGDQYDLAIDLRRNQIDHWTYRPNESRVIGFTWEDYKDFNGLVLSTNHKTEDGKRRIFFTDIEVVR